MPQAAGPCRALESRVIVLVLALAVAMALPSLAQRRSPAEELIERERIRAEVQRAFDLYYRAESSGAQKADNMNVALEDIEAIGEPAAPYLIDELERAAPHNFMFVALALGRVGTPEAEAALRASIEVADNEEGEFAPSKKAWACYALASMGRADAVELISSGKLLAGQHPVHFEMSAVEVAAVFTAPASLASLHKVFDRLEAEWNEREQMRELIAVMRAMRRIADPSSVSRLVRVLEDPDPRTRREAAEALFVFSSPEVVKPLMRLLAEEEQPQVRYSVAWALEQILPAEQAQTFIERLGHEQDPHVRGVLYRIVVRLQGEAALNALRPHLGRPEEVEREALLQALRLQRSEATLPIYRAALADPSVKVIRQAALGLAELDTEKARQVLIDQIGAQRWNVAVHPIRLLAERGVTAAAPAIAERLLDRELAGIVTDPLLREQAYELGRALVRLRHTATIERLGPAMERQTDGMLRAFLADLKSQLSAIAAHGTDAAAWAEVLKSDDATLRHLAIDRLGDLGGPAAAAALVASFGRLSAEDGLLVLDALGRVDDPAARTLLARVLVDEAFDPFERWPLREMAAWSARRLGGPDMIDALRRAWARRSGREGALIAYLPLVAGKEALPWLLEERVSRMRYQKWTRGSELEALDKIVRDVQAGRPISAFDLPPDRLDYRRTSWLP